MKSHERPQERTYGLKDAMSIANGICVYSKFRFYNVYTFSQIYRPQALGAHMQRNQDSRFSFDIQLYI